MKTTVRVLAYAGLIAALGLIGAVTARGAEQVRCGAPIYALSWLA